MDKHMTVGQRTALAIKRHVRYGRVKTELDRLTIPVGTYKRWKLGKDDPQSFWLQQLAFAGYDVHWILTGQVRDNGPEIDFEIAD